MNFPIRVIPAFKEDFQAVRGAGGEKKPFVEVTAEFRGGLEKDLARSLEAIRDRPASREVPSVLEVKLRPEAFAKSHRPVDVLSERTCPIFGVDELGTLFATATPEGVDRLMRDVRSKSNINFDVQLSSIEAIRLFEPVVEPTAEKLMLRLFRHGNEAANRRIDQIARAIVEQGGGTYEELRYAEDLRIVRLLNVNPDIVSQLRRFGGTQAINPFMRFAAPRSSLDDNLLERLAELPVPDPEVDYPLIGIVDGGISSKAPQLQPWIERTEHFVPLDRQRTSHGTFVAGLAIMPGALNPESGFPQTYAKVVDCAVFDAAGTDEDIILENLREIIPRNRDVKVYNMSLGLMSPVNDHSFSPFAIALDEIQREHDVTFVLAAGNYEPVGNYDAWPPADRGQIDRMVPPADSVRAITVGSVAHIGSDAAAIGQPAPYSCKGPGAAYTNKPEVGHFGGNCGLDGDCAEAGVISFLTDGTFGRSMGTSYAAPIASNLLANVRLDLGVSDPAMLARALVIHSAALASKHSTKEIIHRIGYGVPPPLDRILDCESHECTMVFDLLIPPSTEFQRSGFPMPKTLIENGKVKGEIAMTLVTDTDVDPKRGAEYCCTNVNASFGLFAEKDVKTKNGVEVKPRQQKKVFEIPEDIGDGLEASLVEYGQKWCPVKVFRRTMKVGIVDGEWRFFLDVTDRSGHVRKDPLRCVLVVTVSDPSGIKPVYNEMVQALNLAGWVHNDLQLRGRLRAQG